jgi:hypothetical protein
MMMMMGRSRRCRLRCGVCRSNAKEIAEKRQSEREMKRDKDSENRKILFRKAP